MADNVTRYPFCYPLKSAGRTMFWGTGNLGNSPTQKALIVQTREADFGVAYVKQTVLPVTRYPKAISTSLFNG